MKLISLNVEGSKHWDLINPFLEKEQPDVVCLQEVYEDDAVQLAQRLKMRLAVAPMVLYPDAATQTYRKMCVAMLSRLPIDTIAIQDYHLSGDAIQNYDGANEYTVDKTIRRRLLSANINHDGKTFTVATTHFTWTPDGLPRDYQYAAAEKLLAVLEKFPEVMVCGDFNMPRGVNDIYELFAKKYYDAIPAIYRSSVDPNIHRSHSNPAIAARLAGFMIDYLFLTKGYAAKDVRLESGVSDHCAIVATVEIAA